MNINLNTSIDIKISVLLTMPKKVNTHSVNVLQQYLGNNRGKDTFTHTSIGPPMGKYSIKASTHEEFYKLYHQTVFLDRVPTFLTEGIKDRPITPLKIDVDLRYFNADTTRIYTDEDVDRICMKYMEKIDEYLEDLEDSERLFYILEKPSPIYDRDKSGNKKVSDGLFRIKDGFHIMAPEITTNNYLQLKFREHVYKNSNDILDRHNFDNSYADIFDRAVIDRNNWQMYGSTKPKPASQGGGSYPAYMVSRVIRVYKDRVETVDTIPSPKILVSLLSVRNKSDSSLLKPEVEEEVWNPENNRVKKRTYNKKTQNFTRE